MLKQLEVLPSDRFEYTTAGQLIDRYVGGTSNNTTEAMRRAKGGILFIDEAYGMLPSKGNWFGGEIMQALLDNVTSEEYKGKIVVILGGYKEHVEELFAVNPGFQSRFDKIRVEFPEWTGDQAAKAVVNSIVKDGKTITEEAVAALPAYFNSMRELPNWASARDAMELIRPALEVERASRSFVLSKERRLLEDALSSHEQSASGKSLTAGPVGRVNSKLQSKAAKKALPPPISYELCDVLKVFENAINARGGEFSTSIPASTSSNQDASAEIGSSLVKRLKNKIGFTSAVQKTNSEKVKLLVVCFTSPESCHYCRTFAPKFASLAATMTSLEYTVEFASIEDQEVHQMNGVNAVPCTRIYYRGKPLGAEVRGDNEAGLQSEILRQIATISKMKSNAPPPPMLTAPPDGQMGGPPPPPKIKHNFKVKTRDNEDDDDSNDSFDVWAALEEACAELGWSLQQIKDMLEDTANFPPQEILRLIMSSTGCDDAGKIIKMLVPQRAAVLEKVKFSIKENQRLKSAQEAKVQVALAGM